MSVELLSQLPERRRRVRFHLECEVGYRLLDPRRYLLLQSGKTISLSSTSAVFETVTQLPVGELVELFIRWPAKFDNRFPLKMVAQGRVIRSTESQAAVSLLKHEFRIDLDRIDLRDPEFEMQSFIN
jgi:hypothetical protein